MSSAKKFFSEAFLIAVLTGIGYLSAFAYQFSYLRYFGVPMIFVDVNLGSVLLTTFVAFIAILSLVGHSNLLFFKLKNKSFQIAKDISVVFLMVLMVIVPLLAIFFNMNRTAVFGAAIVLAILVVALIIYIQKHPLENLDETSDLFSMAERNFGSSSVGFIAASIFFIIYCAGLGAAIAQTKIDYLVPSSDPGSVIISTYSGDFLSLRFDSNTKTFDTILMLISKEKVSTKGIVFYNQKVGPLKPGTKN